MSAQPYFQKDGLAALVILETFLDLELWSPYCMDVMALLLASSSTTSVRSFTSCSCSASTCIRKGVQSLGLHLLFCIGTFLKIHITASDEDSEAIFELHREKHLTETYRIFFGVGLQEGTNVPFQHQDLIFPCICLCFQVCDFHVQLINSLPHLRNIRNL